MCVKAISIPTWSLWIGNMQLLGTVIQNSGPHTQNTHAHTVEVQASHKEGSLCLHPSCRHGLHFLWMFVRLRWGRLQWHWGEPFWVMPQTLLFAVCVLWCEKPYSDEFLGYAVPCSEKCSIIIMADD